MDWTPFNYHIIVNGTNTTRENVIFPPQTEEYEHEITNISFRDVDNGVTSARIFVTNGVNEQFFRQWTTLTADTIYYENRTLIPLSPGERCGIAFYGITAGDTLEVAVRGKRRLVE